MRKGLSIRNKFILVVAVIFIVLIGFSFFLTSVINQLASVTLDILNHPLEVSNAASYANVEVVRMHRDLKEILLVEEDYEINILVDKIRVSENKVYTALDTIAYDILGDDGKFLEEEARMLFDDWKVIRSEVIDSVRDGRADFALEITRNKGADHITSLERKLLELNQYARKKAEEFQSNSIELELNTKSIALIGIIIVLFIVTVTIIWLSWSVLGGIGFLSKSLNDIMMSGEFKSVKLSGNDELTELSIIFNDLVTSLGNQLWVKEGNKKLNDVLSNTHNFEDGVSKYVEELCIYGEFLSVAYYHRYNHKLVLKGVVNRMGFMEDEYLVGQQFIGECALHRTTKEIIYNESDFRGELPYKEIIVMPVSYNDEVYGVSCTVFHKAKTHESAELLNECTKDFSAYISTYEQRKKIDGLLEQSIQTNEQLIDRQISLEENQEELEAVNSTLQEQRDLLNTKSNELVKQNRELVNLREELVKKYKDLEEVTKYRSQFLTNISHELRTPLNSIIVLSNMLKEKSKDEFNEKDEEKILVITKAANRLLHTINDILDLSKVESGKIDLNEEIFDPEDLMTEWLAIYNPLIDEKKLDSKFRNLTSCKLYGDKDKLSHIVTNFLSNAIKFTQEGFVNVTICLNDDIDFPIKIDVSDSGIGIRKDKLEDIFVEFVQTDGSIGRMYGGTGLGLAISKNYAKLINGKINVVSTVGKGSTFSILLPSSCISDDYSLSEMKSSSYMETKHDSSKHELLAIHRNKEVLICDDEPMNVFALSAMLEDIGVLPVAALTSYEAVEGLKNNPFIKMILMDLMMPKVDGFSTIKLLKETKEWKDIPVVIITSATLEEKEINVIGKEGYILIRKPIIYNEIVKLLNENL